MMKCIDLITQHSLYSKDKKFVVFCLIRIKLFKILIPLNIFDKDNSILEKVLLKEIAFTDKMNKNYVVTQTSKCVFIDIFKPSVLREVEKSVNMNFHACFAILIYTCYDYHTYLPKATVASLTPRFIPKIKITSLTKKRSISGIFPEASALVKSRTTSAGIPSKFTRCPSKRSRRTPLPLAFVAI